MDLWVFYWHGVETSGCDYEKDAPLHMRYGVSIMSSIATIQFQLDNLTCPTTWRLLWNKACYAKLAIFFVFCDVKDVYDPHEDSFEMKLSLHYIAKLSC